MADLVTTKILRNTDAAASILCCGASDGTGETAIQKVDISALVMAASKVRITKMKWSIQSMTVQVLFDHSTDDSAAILSGQGELNAAREAAITDPGSSGGTGDILFTTKVPASSLGNGYTVYLELEKVA